MIRIDLLTTTRAEYGLMRPLIKRFYESEDFSIKILITGTHLSEEYGYTITEIEYDGYDISNQVKILSEKKGTDGIAETMANAIVRFTEFFKNETDKPDFLFVDGDRYETMAICLAALNCNIPIIHAGGGQITEGSTDDYYRHLITKMSYIHFATTDIYRDRIIRMGESPDRVFNVGSMGLENIRNEKLLTKMELEEQLNFRLDKPYSVVTFHPATRESEAAEKQVTELLAACDKRNDMKFVFTKANADKDGDKINLLLDEYALKHQDTCICLASLGVIRYLSAVKYCEFVLGNSSSGIIEVPSLKVPTINIGSRQKGRIQATSILNCNPLREEILAAMEYALTPEMKKKCENTVNPYGDGDVSRRIIAGIKEVYQRENGNWEKKYYDGPKDLTIS